MGLRFWFLQIVATQLKNWVSLLLGHSASRKWRVVSSARLAARLHLGLLQDPVGQLLLSGVFHLHREAKNILAEIYRALPLLHEDLWH